MLGVKRFPHVLISSERSETMVPLSTSEAHAASEGEDAPAIHPAYRSSFPCLLIFFLSRRTLAKARQFVRP